LAEAAETSVPSGPDIENLAWEFMASSYGRAGYVGWSLDRRIHGFLKRRGLAGKTNDGDLCDSLACRVMTLVSGHRRLRTPGT